MIYLQQCIRSEFHASTVWWHCFGFYQMYRAEGQRAKQLLRLRRIVILLTVCVHMLIFMAFVQIFNVFS